MAYSFPQQSGRPVQRLEMFEQLAKRIPTKDGRVAGAITRLVQSYKELTELHARLGKDETATPGARLVRLAKSARANIGPLMDELNAALESMAERRVHLQEEIAKVYNPPGKTYETVMRHQEIRALFRSMPRGDAHKALEKARQEGDEDTLIALVSYQPFLSGIAPELHHHARNHLVEIHAPDHGVTLKALNEQSELAANFSGEMGASVGALVDFKRADEIMAAARDDAAA